MVMALPMVPCGSSPVARLYLAKNKAPEEEAAQSHYTKAWHKNLSDIIWRSTFEIGAAQLRSAAEIAPKSPLLCVNRIWYGFSCRRRSYSVPNPIIGLGAGMFSPPNPLHWFVLSVQYPTRLQNSRFFSLLKIAWVQLKSFTRAKRQASHARDLAPLFQPRSRPFVWLLARTYGLFCKLMQ